jgi:hypothetical protein
MSSVLVVVTDILIHQAFQVPFVENDYRVEQIPSAVADPSFCDAVLPRTSEAGLLRLDAKVLHGVNDFLVELCAAIEKLDNGVPSRKEMPRAAAESPKHC